MRPRSLAWLLTILSIVMVCVLAWRVNKGWPAGPRTWAFIVATLVALVATIVTWRRASAPVASAPPIR